MGIDKGKEVVTMGKQISLRLDDVHSALLDEIVAKLESDGVKTNKTDVIQKALYAFAYDNVLGSERVGKIIDEHYRGALSED